jgi:hypothetical protein|tara:strand:+ start:123 stop:377 length:255 start_codon:yes stop_codon:yes gene_type:complete
MTSIINGEKIERISLGDWHGSKKLGLPRKRSPEDTFVENIVSSTRLMKEREGIQRKLLDALARDLLKQGVPLNKLIRNWSNKYG